MGLWFVLAPAIAGAILVVFGLLRLAMAVLHLLKRVANFPRFDLGAVATRVEGSLDQFEASVSEVAKLQARAKTALQTIEGAKASNRATSARVRTSLTALRDDLTLLAKSLR